MILPCILTWSFLSIEKKEESRFASRRYKITASLNQVKPQMLATCHMKLDSTHPPMGRILWSEPRTLTSSPSVFHRHLSPRPCLTMISWCRLPLGTLVSLHFLVNLAFVFWISAFVIPIPAYAALSSLARVCWVLVQDHPFSVLTAYLPVQRTMCASNKWTAML